MNVVVLYESRTGNTKRAAEYIGGAARAGGADVGVYPVTAPDLHALSQADLVFIGTWTDGLILLGHRPGGGRHLKALPVLDRKRVGVFCTYAVNPGRCVDKLASLVERKLGVDVVARASFNRNEIEDPAARFVDLAMESVPA